jgi:ParB/RepB/Spo0J family partition protein
MSARRDGYKVSGILTSRPAQADAAPLEFPTAPVGPVTLMTVQPAAPAPALEAAQPAMPAQTSDDPQSAELVDDVVYELDPDLFDDSAFQPEDAESNRYDPVGISELAQAFATAGQSTPIKARRKENGRYEIIAGHRRIRAARLIRARIKAILVTMTDRAARLAVMIDNEGIKAKSDYQKAKLYQTALDENYATKHDEIAAMFAASKAAVSKRLSMMRLPAPILALLEETPTLFGASTAGVLHDLIAQHPEHVTVITQAAARLKEPGVTENSIRPWVAQMISSLTSPRPVIDGRENTRIITDKKQRSLYTARLRGRVLTIRVDGTTIDPDQVLDRIAEVLQSDPKLVSTDQE